MSKKAFWWAIGVGLAATVGSFSPLSALAQMEKLADSLASAAAVELAQMPEGRDSVMPLSEDTLVFSQTEQLAVRVYTTEDIPRLNLFNKQTRRTEILGAPVTIEPTEIGTTYRYQGESAVAITVTSAGEQTITIDGTPQQASDAITGTIFYLPRIALPPNAVIEVSLVDVSRADAPAITLSSMKMSSGDRQVPFSFELLYDAGQIDARYTYAIQSRITVDGELQFINTSQFPVITNGNPTEVQVQVDPVDSPANQTEANETQMENRLVGTVWQLEQIQYNNDTLIEANPPSDYTLEFMGDGQISIRTDCNQALGSFTEDGSSVSIDLGPTTLAACGPESVDSEYLQALNSAGIYFFQDEKLFIDLQADTGTMQFSKGE